MVLVQQPRDIGVLQRLLRRQLLEGLELDRLEVDLPGGGEELRLEEPTDGPGLGQEIAVAWGTEDSGGGDQVHTLDRETSAELEVQLHRFQVGGGGAGGLQHLLGAETLAAATPGDTGAQRQRRQQARKPGPAGSQPHGSWRGTPRTVTRGLRINTMIRKKLRKPKLGTNAGSRKKTRMNPKKIC